MGVSLREDNAFQTKSLAIITDNSSFENYWQLLTATNFLLWLKNSMLISLAVTILGVALASTSAYALSRYKFMGRNLGMTALLTTQMFPATMLLLPFFILLSKLGLINSYLGLVIIYSSITNYNQKPN